MIRTNQWRGNMLDAVKEYNELYQNWKELHETLDEAIEMGADAAYIISLGRDIITTDYALKEAGSKMYNEIY
ncbi:hypothetical protein SAGEFAYGE_237 [Bacillus phage SageFayge]|uniref:Uncharacterized protein n=3 Tax=Wphvirus TaxID=1922327 RepID=A0A143FLT1_9CAUD|nr:hypothetical protein BIZ89_gp242 [Bacillus phage Kida]YP_009281040.1 hypothetical protein SAGEFAYGE_237 [Bacillus phage SageFayge]AMW63157.1 hypothetical protein SAGEFAYGE_237 [Bacillus phage SageFayge]ANU79995.1 hypothetical protein KIDA_244 [Bacillus phage Kida]